MDEKSKKKDDKIAKIVAYILILIMWLGLGGIATMLPSFPNGAGNHTAGFFSLITWLLLPFTLALIFIKQDRFNISIFIINLLGWIFFTIWIWSYILH